MIRECMAFTSTSFIFWLSIVYSNKFLILMYFLLKSGVILYYKNLQFSEKKNVFLFLLFESKSWEKLQFKTTHGKTAIWHQFEWFPGHGWWLCNHWSMSGWLYLQSAGVHHRSGSNNQWDDGYNTVSRSWYYDWSRKCKFSCRREPGE